MAVNHMLEEPNEDAGVSEVHSAISIKSTRWFHEGQESSVIKQKKSLRGFERKKMGKRKLL